MKFILLSLVLMPFIAISQQITNISPAQGMQGQSVPLIISGNNMSFSGWSCWSNTSNLSDFRFSQWSNTNMFFGSPLSSSSQQLNGTANIPQFQPIGVYNLEVWDCYASQWIIFLNSFQVTPSLNNVSESEIKELIIFPNPLVDEINIQFHTLMNQDILITISDLKGNTIYSKKINNHIGNYFNKMNLSEFSKSVYVLEIMTTSGKVSKKIVLQ